MSQPSRSGGSRALVEVPADELAIIEQALSKYIGPMARVLVRKELARQATFRADDQTRRAVELHRAGKLDEARALYRAVLDAAQPGVAGAGRCVRDAESARRR